VISAGVTETRQLIAKRSTDVDALCARLRALKGLETR
jgi:hypothetical protein